MCRYVAIGLLFFGFLVPDASAQRRLFRRSNCQSCQGNHHHHAVVPVQGITSGFDSTPAMLPMNQPQPQPSTDQRTVAPALPAKMTPVKTAPVKTAPVVRAEKAVSVVQPVVEETRQQPTAFRIQQAESNQSNPNWEGRLFTYEAPTATNENVAKLISNRRRDDRRAEPKAAVAATGLTDHWNTSRTAERRVARDRSTARVASRKTGRRVAKRENSKAGYLWLLPLCLLPFFGWFAFGGRRKKRYATVAAPVAAGTVAAGTAVAAARKTTTTVATGGRTLAANGKVATAGRTTTSTTPVGTSKTSTPVAGKITGGKATAAERTTTSTTIAGTSKTSTPVAGKITGGKATAAGRTTSTTTAAASKTRTPVAETPRKEANVVTGFAGGGKRSFAKGDFEHGVAKNGVWQQPGRKAEVAPSSFTTKMDRPASKRDNLTVIDGICPKTQNLLYAAGITTFGALANSDSHRRVEALIPGGSRFTSKDTTDWTRLARKAMAPRVERATSSEYRDEFNQFERTERDSGNFVNRDANLSAMGRRQRDDLTAIDGICPKTQKRLNAGGIYSYTDLANADASRMESVLKGESSFSRRDTSRWARQAREFSTSKRVSGNFGRELILPETTRRQRDDLTVIEGICQKTQQHLNAGGIYTYAELANADASRIDEVLKAGGPSVSLRDTSWWSREARVFSSEERDCVRRENRDDFTVIRGVDEDLQKAFYAAGIYNFGDLAIADRNRLKQTLTRRDARFASVDVDRYCEQSMRFVRAGFWDADEREMLTELNDMNREVQGFWDRVATQVKRSGESVIEKFNAAAKVGE